MNRLEITGPVAECGRCHFSHRLDGNWTIEGGVLTWRAMRDPLTGRGPDLEGCCESDHDGDGAIQFDVIETDGAALPVLQQKLLRAVARRAQRRWERDDDGYL